MKKLFLILVILFSAITLFAQEQESLYGVKALPHSKAPDFKIEMTTGEWIQLSDLKGKVVMLDFSSVTCGPCIFALKSFKKNLYDKYAGTDLVVIPIISHADNMQMVQDFKKTHGFDFPFGFDKNNEIIKKFFYKKGLPAWVVIDRFGIIFDAGPILYEYANPVAKALEKVTYSKKYKANGTISELVVRKNRIDIHLGRRALLPYVSTKDKKSEAHIAILREAYSNQIPIEFEYNEGEYLITSVKLLPKKPVVKAVPKKTEIPVTAYNGVGVNFESLSYAQALEKAKKENKKLFINCSSEGCGPCAAMDKYVFVLPEVGDFFTKEFISIKLKSSQSGDGFTIPNKFNLKAYPTYLILNSDGTLYNKMVGSRDERDLLEELGNVMTNPSKSLSAMAMLHDSGKMTNSELSEYLIPVMRSGNAEKAKQVTAELNLRIKGEERLGADYWNVLQTSTYGSDGYQFIIDNYASLSKNLGKERVDNYFRVIYRSALSSMSVTPQMHVKLNVKPLSTLVEELAKVDFNGKEQIVMLCDLVKYSISNDQVKFSQLTENLSNNYEKNDIAILVNMIKNCGSRGDQERILPLKDKMCKEVNSLSKPFVEEAFIAIERGIKTQN